jgi:hypothetical protein
VPGTLPPPTPHLREVDLYESLLRGNVDGRTDAVGVNAHEGDGNAFLERHRQAAAKAVRDGVRGVRSIAPDLLRRIGDTRTLRLAWDYLAGRGGQAPGPNGLRYRDLASVEVWDLCRCLAQAIRAGTYRPGPERVKWVPKNSGKGARPIVLSDIEDRVVQRAAVLILQPILDPLFDARSFGYRPGVNHLHALALAERLTLDEHRRVWVAEDIRDAFQHVPVSRLSQVVAKLLPVPDLLGLLNHILPGQTLPGLRQGGCLSPLMLNVYLNHVLDRPWRRFHLTLPLIRVADDLLVLCKNERQAEQAHATLNRLLVPAGLPLKGSVATTVHKLADGATAEWLGLVIRKAPRGLAFEIADRSWVKLERALELAHTKPDSSIRAALLAEQWLAARGPCYVGSDRDAVCKGIVDRALAQAFEELPGHDDLMDRWKEGHDRWERIRKSTRAACQRIPRPA